MTQWDMHSDRQGRHVGLYLYLQLGLGFRVRWTDQCMHVCMYESLNVVWVWGCVYVYVCVCVCARARACVCVCVRTRACMSMCECEQIACERVSVYVSASGCELSMWVSEWVSEWVSRGVSVSMCDVVQCETVWGSVLSACSMCECGMNV